MSEELPCGFVFDSGARCLALEPHAVHHGRWGGKEPNHEYEPYDRRQRHRRVAGLRGAAWALLVSLDNPHLGTTSEAADNLRAALSEPDHADPLDVQAEPQGPEEAPRIPLTRDWPARLGSTLGPESLFAASNALKRGLPPQPRPFVRPSAGDKGGPLHPDDHIGPSLVGLLLLVLAFAAGVAVGWVVWG